MLSDTSKVVVANISLKTCIENVMVHNALSIEDQYEEILCIEQNLQSFHNFTNFKDTFSKFTKDFKFDMSAISLS